MSVRGAGLAAAIACTVVAVGAQPPARAPQAFRTGTDVVFVDVSVRDGNRAVTELRAGDFELTDNGVRQRVESVEATAVPIDLTVIVDVSGNPGRPWTRRMRESQVASTIEREFAEIRTLLRPSDRVRMFAIDTDVQMLMPLTESTAVKPVTRVRFEGMAALYDTLAAALLQPSEPARRHVIVARTKGRDTISSVSAEAITAIARKSDALFHIVMMETAFTNEQAFDAFQCDRNLMGICAPTVRSWTPYQRLLYTIGERRRLLPDGLALEEASEATGGGLHRTEVIAEPTLTSTFRRTFEDFRNGYMLRYAPQGVARAGWHTIDVKIRGRNSYAVRARKGYGVDTPAPAPGPAPVPAEPRTVQDFVRAYERNDFSSLAPGLRKSGEPAALLRSFQEGRNPWPATPNKEAAFALELVEPAVFSSRGGDREAAYSLLRRFTTLVRDPLEPGLFERYWHFTVLTMLEGSIRPSASEAFVASALQRFPKEPRFVLSRAIVTDQRWAVQGVTLVTGADGVPTAEHIDQVRSQYEAAIAMPEVAAEARIRLAWFLHRIGRHGQAVVHLKEAETELVRDPSLRYLRHLFLGHALTALGDHAQASRAFEAARAEMPGAQSPKVALMNLALLRNDHAAAEAMAE
jgi:VWFA-related protein